MSRDFDARVRDLTEAPLSLDEVKGKAVKIRRNRRIAAAGGALAVAAAVTPIALVATSDGDTDTNPPPATQTAENTTPAAIDYLADGTWHQGDGDEVTIPEGDYYAAAAIWDGQLVVQRPANGDVSDSVTEIIDADGNVVDSFPSNEGVAVGEDGTFFAYISDDGTLTSVSADGEIALTEGLDGNMMPAAATGDPACGAEANTCTVYVNDGDGAARAYSSDGVPRVVTPETRTVNDASGDLVTLIDGIDETVPETCGGLYDLAAGDFTFHGCDYMAHQVSPDGRYVAATQSYLSGFGVPAISILDVDGNEHGRWSDGATITTWEWTTDGRLMFKAHDGTNWRLFAMKPDGEVKELTDPIRGGDMDSPYTLIRH